MRLFLRLAVVTAVLLASATARATPARVVGIGDLGNYVEDDTNVLMYPSAISRYAHFAFIDIGGANGVKSSFSEVQASGGANGGALVRFGDFQVGVLTSDFAPIEGSAFLAHAAGARESMEGGVWSGTTTSSGGNKTALEALAAMSTMRRYDIVLGYGTAKDFAAGLRFSFGGADESANPPSGLQIIDSTKNPAEQPYTQLDKRWVSQARVVAGVSVNLGSGSMLDASIDYTNFSSSFVKNGLATFTGGGGNAIGLSTRLRMPITRNWGIIPQLSYRGWFFGLDEKWTMPGFGPSDPTQSVPLDGGRESLTHSAAMHSLDIGSAAELKASKFATFWLAVGVTVFSSSTTDTDKRVDMNNVTTIDSTHLASTLQWGLPYVKFGTEVAPFEWMHARFGAEKYALATSGAKTDTDNTNKPDDSKKPNTISSSTANSFEGLGAPADFNIYAGASFLLMPGFNLDILLKNQIFLGDFKAGWGGRAALSYKF